MAQAQRYACEAADAMGSRTIMSKLGAAFDAAARDGG